MRPLLTALAEDTLACLLAIAALAVLAVTLGSNWHTGIGAALAISAGGALLAYLLVWARVPPGLAPLLAQGIGAVAAVRLVATVPPSLDGPLLVLHDDGASPATAWLLDAVYHAAGPDRAVPLLLLFLLWEVAYTVVWLVLRERWAWAASALAGASLVAAGGAAGVIGGEVAVFAVPALALILWTTAAGSAARWRLEGVAVAPGVRWTGLGAGLVALLVLGALAWAWAPPTRAMGFAPSLPANIRLPDVGRLWQQATTRLGMPVATSAPVTSPAPLLGQGAPLRLDRPFDPSGRAAVLVGGAIPAGWPSMYWRSAVYETYIGATWQPAGAGRLTAARAPLQTVAPGEPTVDLHYRLPGAPAGATLVSAGQLLSLSVPALVSYGPAGALTARAATAAPEYDALSTWPAAAAPAGVQDETWNAADVSWPSQWTDLAALARRVTAGVFGAQNQAAALEAYLRTHFTYDTQVGSPPAGTDPVLYFLFSSRRGYCTHFASAMVLLARSLGLPARLVGGYVGGVADPTASQDNGVILRDSDAHTWPEIYLPQRGWTLYEPTPGFGRPGTAAAAGPSAATPAPAGRARQPVPVPATPPTHASKAPPWRGTLPFVPTWNLLAIPLVALPALGALAAVVRRQIRRRRPPTAQAIALYERMARRSRAARLGPRTGETAREHAHRVAARDGRAGPDVLLLAGLHDGVCYGGRVPTSVELAAARAAAARLRWLWLWRRRVPLQLSANSHQPSAIS